jgi:hypothetical protein
VDVPAGAAITVDGTRREGTEFFLDPGAHTVRIEATGFEPYVYQDTLVTGELVTLTYGGAPIAPPPAAPGFLRFSARPWANVSINGVLNERVTVRIDSVPPGEYRLRFERPGFVTVDTTVLVRSGETTVVPLVRMIQSG